MNRPRRIYLVVALAAVGAITWFGLHRPPEPATWCTLEASPQAVVGQQFTVRVRLLEPISDNRLAVDLHWASSPSEHRRVLLASPAGIKPDSAGIVDVAFALPTRSDLHFVQPVLYLAPDGRWRDRVRAASTALIPVQQVTESPVNENATLVPVHAMEVGGPPQPTPDEPWIVRGTLALLGVLGAVACWHRRRHPGAKPLLAGCVAAVIWELTSVERALGFALRMLALEYHVYWGRGPIQLVLTTLITMATTAAAARTLMRPQSPGWRVAWLGFWSYAGLSLASFLSLHEVDALLGTQLMGLTLGQLAQFVALAATGIGGHLAREGKEH
jgi:hypothetical protein